MLKFATVFKNLREENGYSQQEIADKLKISRGSVSNYEQGTREPSFEMLETIADLFNVDMDYLMGKSPIKNKSTLSGANLHPANDINISKNVADLDFLCRLVKDGDKLVLEPLEPQTEKLSEKGQKLYDMIKDLPEDALADILNYAEYQMHKSKSNP